MKTVLVSGASITGPALAWWLHRHGFRPTLVEKSPVPRPGGHAIDIRGVAGKVVQAMGLAEAIHDKRTRMKGMSIVDESGTELFRSEEMTISGGSFDLDGVEILRDDLANILLSALPEDIEILYGDSVAALGEEDDGVLVQFEKAAPRKFDLVVGADGIGSHIRNLVFGEDTRFLHQFGIALAPYSTPNVLGLEDWQVVYRAGDYSCMVYTARDNRELRVNFRFNAALEDVLRIEDPRDQKAFVREKCGHLGGDMPRLLDLMEQAPDFYLGPIAQVRMAPWSRGRVVLVGDAAYCPSPLTGQGTSLALVGAYLLAWELAKSPDDHAAAFTRYEDRMRPFVDRNQAVADLTNCDIFSDPEYYTTVVEPALEEAKDAIELEGLG